METRLSEQPQMPITPAQTGEEALFVVGVSRSMQGLDRLIRELADSDMPVLLMSEPGAGKKRTAEHIHQLSNRCQRPFLVISGAQVAAPTFQEQSLRERFLSDGTTYIDEIGNLDIASQKALLAVLSRAEENGNHTQCARLICGTTHDLEADVREGRFCEDLYYRISGLSLRLLPLRQRKEDIPHLLTFFLRRYATELNCPVPSLSLPTQQLFLEYSWPGNLRELEDAARVIVTMGDESLAMGGLRSLLTKSERHNGKRVSLKEVARTASREAERELILEVLTRTRWNRRRAAEELQISYKALLYKLKQIGYENSGGTS